MRNDFLITVPWLLNVN